MEASGSADAATSRTVVVPWEVGLPPSGRLGAAVVEITGPPAGSSARLARRALSPLGAREAYKATDYADLEHRQARQHDYPCRTATGQQASVPLRSAVAGPNGTTASAATVCSRDDAASAWLVEMASADSHTVLG